MANQIDLKKRLIGSKNLLTVLFKNYYVQCSVGVYFINLK